MLTELLYALALTIGFALAILTAVVNHAYGAVACALCLVLTAVWFFLSWFAVKWVEAFIEGD